MQEAHQSQFENIFTRIKNSAPIQHVLYSLGKAFGRNQDSDANKAKKQEVLTDMQNSAYEEFLYQTAKTDKDELKDIRVNKGDNRYNTVSRNNTHQPLNNDFQFKDSDDDLEL